MGPDDDEDPVAAPVPDEDVPDEEVADEEHAASREAVTAAISISTCRLRFFRSEIHFTELLRSSLGVLRVLRISWLFLFIPKDESVLGI